MTGSFALGLKRTGHSGTIVGVADSKEINLAWKSGILSDGSANLAEVLPGSDLILLATQASLNQKTLQAVMEAADDDAIISEMTRIKAQVSRMFDEASRGNLHYVGFRLMGDPPEDMDLRQSEKFYFDGRTIILTPRSRDDLSAYQSMADALRRMGAQIVAMSPEAHDRFLARVNHVPRIVSLAILERVFAETDDYGVTSALLGPRLTKEVREIIGSRGMEWAADVDANRAVVLESLRDVISRLEMLHHDIADDRLAVVRRGFHQLVPAEFKEPEQPETPSLIVVIGTESKDLTRVSQLMAQSRIKLGELEQLEHAEAGTFRMTFQTQEDCERALALLKRAGFEVSH